MAAQLGPAALFSRLDRGQAVGNADPGDPHRFDRFRDHLLGAIVEGTGGLVEDEHLRGGDQGPGDRDPLHLAAGDVATGFADVRQTPLRRMHNGERQVLFAGDLFNEGLNIPSPDSGKSCLKVLDFIGPQHRRFRFDLRYSALLDCSRRQLQKQLEQGFPFLPPGCRLVLTVQLFGTGRHTPCPGPCRCPCAYTANTASSPPPPAPATRPSARRCSTERISAPPPRHPPRGSGLSITRREVAGALVCA